MFDLQKFWDYFNKQMRQEYNEVAYNAWFKNTKPVSYNKETNQNSSLLLKILLQKVIGKLTFLRS